MSRTGILQVILLILKVTDTVDWSWWIILIPFWIVLIAVIVKEIIISKL